MFLSPEKVTKIVESNKENLAFNNVIIDIFDGNLQEYVIQDIKAQLTEQSFTQALHRLSPINILPKVIDKLTNIYQTNVTRYLKKPNSTDAMLLDYYENQTDINTQMNESNELFNLCRSSLIYPYVHKGHPKISIIENDRFIPFASDRLNSKEITHVILLGEKVEGKETYWVWSSEQFYVVDSDQRMRTDIMAQFNNPEGINPIGRLPFVYLNESRRKLVPKHDKDMLTMIKLIPIMLTDLNLAAMYQSFSITYGINVDDQNLVRAPNAFWTLKSDPTTDQAPQIGTIKPDVDYDQVLALIEAQMTMWLGTKGIKASSIGSLKRDNLASGISKIIDEMDTFEARQKQTKYYKKAEKEFWDLIINGFHPYWVSSGQIDITAQFTSSAEISTDFSIQLPQQTRGQIVRDVKEEYNAGFITKKIALETLNPEMSDVEIEALMEELSEIKGSNPLPVI